MASPEKKKAEAFTFELVSPAQIELRGHESKVVIPGLKGDFMVLPGHTRMITNLREGVLRVIRNDQEAHQLYIAGGFADIGPDHCTVLASQAIPIHKLDEKTLQERLELLTDDLQEASEETKPDLEKEIAQIKTKLEILESLKG